MLLFKDSRRTGPRPGDPREEDEAGLRGGRPRIRCPHCSWEPRREDRWSCECGWIWHTFDTFGTCPACERRWHETQCLACHDWSPHPEWYADGDDEDGDPRPS